jgi:hypothetical protein
LLIKLTLNPRLTRPQHASSLSASGEQRAVESAPRQGIFREPVLHSRNLFVLLLSKLPHRAGVSSGLDSFEAKSHHDDPPANKRGGFFSFQQSGARDQEMQIRGQ